MGQTRSRETTHSVREAGEAFAAIERTIQALGDINAQVASASEEQAATSLEVNDNIQQVSGRNKDMLTQAGQARDLARELEALMEQVEQKVSVFRTR